MALPHLLQKVEPLDEKVVKARSAPEFIQVHRQVRRMKVVCVSIPEAGHLVPTVQVAKALAQRGHEAILVTMDCAAGKFAKGCEAVGCRFVGLVKGMPGSDAGHGPIAEFHRRGQMMQAFFQYCELMQEELRDFLRSDGADVIVADFASFSAQRVAEELQIPCIFNVPGPLELCRNLSMWLAMPFCFAVAIMTRSLTETRLTYSMFSELVPALKRHVCLVNSFYGLDLPSTVPAHVVLTGPTAPRSGNDLSRRETSDEKMNRWLADHVRPEGLQIVYVTMGSMQILEQFQLEALFYGLKSLTPKVAVAWSMKEEQHRQLPGGHEALPSHWFVQKWLPQGEALHLPEVAVVVTHCGFGGLNETLAAGKPLVALPFRADQPGNAQLAQKRGFAEVLKPRTLTAHGVQAALQKVLTDGKYAQRAREVQGSLLKTKGAQACVEAIEDFMERDGCQELFLRDTVASRRPLALLAALGATMALGALGYVQLRRS